MVSGQWRVTGDRPGTVVQWREASLVTSASSGVFIISKSASRAYTRKLLPSHIQAMSLTDQDASNYEGAMRQRAQEKPRARRRRNDEDVSAGDDAQVPLAVWRGRCSV